MLTYVYIDGRVMIMCTVMVVDENQMTRNWLQECIQNSNIKVGKVVLFKTGEEAAKYISKNNVDIALARIQKEDYSSTELVKTMHKKLLFSIVLGYGTCKDFDFLCNIFNYGISQYLQDVFNKNKINAILNEAYERYCSSKIKLKFMTEISKEKTEKAYTEFMLMQFVDAYARNAKANCEENVENYIDVLLNAMDNQQLYHSKSMILELMIIITQQVGKGLIKTDFVLFNSKDCSAIMNFKNVEELKKMVVKYLHNLAKNIYLFSSAKDYKSVSIFSATNYIKNNYRNDISRDDVAAAVNLNPSYFSKFFKEQMGESFVSYLRRIRLEEAKTSLEDTIMSVKAISEKVGYSDSKYFARLFYDHTGYTPCEYRKSINKLLS